VDASTLARFEAKVAVDMETGCWLWLAARSGNNGYGAFRLSDGRRGYAHRVSYEHFVGPIPDGLQIDHLCRNRACCNPAHLEAVTQAENVLRGRGFAAVNARKTRCPSGHLYDETNTCHSGRSRYCRACARDKMRRRREAALILGAK
jgi:hypothetical protein